MDPRACLDDVRAAIADHDYENARDHLDDYYAWCQNGGLEPACGDAVAAAFAHICMLHGFGESR